jgi:Zn-dependent protease
MLRFQLFGFPVFIHWSFWAVVAMLGGAFSADTPQQMQRLLVWVLVALVSILIHELGHAFTMRRLGDPRVIITLHSFGGFAAGTRRLTRVQDVFVSAAGPLVQILAGLAVGGVLRIWAPENFLMRIALGSFEFISVRWALLNLLPIIPLDGGRISLALFGPRREKIALGISLVVAVGLGVWAISAEWYFAAIILALLAFNNFKRLRGEPEHHLW